MGKRSFAARLQQLFSAHDMTLGAPWKRILEFAIPLSLIHISEPRDRSVSRMPSSA